MVKNYKLICFDLDDTLWPCMPTIYNAENALYKWLSEHQSAITGIYSIEQLRDKRKQLMTLQPELRCDLSEARRVHFRQLANEFQLDESWVEPAFNVFYQARQKVNLFDDVMPVLSELKKQFKLVALTNGNAHIEKTGLADMFDFQISAADVKAAKPHPAMFVRAMGQLGVKPNETLHVGDHPIHDIQGARNAGIDSVWLTRFSQVWDDDGAKAEMQFDDLYQLQKWLLARP